MKKLTENNFPITKMKVKFITKDNFTHYGRYDFNSLMQRRWIDNDGNEYTSDLVDSWELINDNEG